MKQEVVLYQQGKLSVVCWNGEEMSLFDTTQVRNDGILKGQGRLRKNYTRFVVKYKAEGENYLQNVFLNKSIK
jgi:hypothetical protein